MREGDANSSGTRKLLMQSNRTCRGSGIRLRERGANSCITRAPLSPIEQRASSRREMKREEEMPRARAAAATWPTLLSERERCWEGGYAAVQSWKRLVYLKSRAGGHCRLQHEGNTGINAVVAHIERKQALAFAYCVEDDRPTILPEVVGAEPQPLDNLRRESVPNARRTHRARVQFLTPC